MAKRRKYTPGFEDAERLFDHLDGEERKARQREYLEEKESRKNPQKGEVKKNENNG